MEFYLHLPSSSSSSSNSALRPSMSKSSLPSSSENRKIQQSHELIHLIFKMAIYKNVVPKTEISTVFCKSLSIKKRKRFLSLMKKFLEINAQYLLRHHHFLPSQLGLLSCLLCCPFVSSLLLWLAIQFHLPHFNFFKKKL